MRLEVVRQSHAGSAMDRTAAGMNGTGPTGPRESAGRVATGRGQPTFEPAHRASLDDVASASTGAARVSADDAPAETNYLLRRLQEQSPCEYARLLPALDSVTLSRGHMLFEPGEPIADVHFPASCVASLIKVLSDGKRIEVGTTGLEGMAGLPAFLDAASTPIQGVIQIAGRARRMTVAALRELAVSGTALHGLLQRYAQYVFDQAAQSTACNSLHRVEQRCARWLLMTHDRVRADEFELTHEYLAAMLGVRRASVSEVAESLQEAGLIRYRRGRIAIVDRAGLERASCECYESDRADYDRLFPRVSWVGPVADAASQHV
jgi:CRP-like cAMP-binding protein